MDERLKTMLFHNARHAPLVAIVSRHFTGFTVKLNLSNIEKATRSV